MKKIFLISLLFAGFAQSKVKAQPQRLIVLNMGKVMAQNGMVSLEAFCADIARPAPDYISTPVIYFGGNNTMIRYKENGVVKGPISLDVAKRNHKIIVEIEEFNVNILPANNRIKIVDIITRGMGVGADADGGILTQELMNHLPLYRNGLNPIDMWPHIQPQITKNKRTSKQQTTDYIKYHLTKESPLEFLATKIDENGKIILHDNNKNGGSPPFDFLKDRNFAEDLLDNIELEDGKICIEISSDGNAVLKIGGKFNGIMPVEIEFTSEKKIVISAQLGEADIKNMKTGGRYDVGLKVHYETGDKPSEEECKIKPSIIICYPLAESGISLNVCGVDIFASLKNMEIAF